MAASATTPAADPQEPAKSLVAPLRVRVFRRIWLASLLTNFGLLIQGVGAAWSMVQMTGGRPDMVALVQTALMLPIFLVSMAAGALADMFDRRKVALFALGVGITGATTLSILSYLDHLTPTILLAFTFTIGTGMALFGPAWQASVAEQVPVDILPQAVALNSMSYNIARSFGPAIGGIVVAAAGAVAAFTVNAVFYLPLMIVLGTWHRTVAPSRLPPENIGRALHAGFRFIVHSPPVRTALWRTFAIGLTGASISGLMPMIAKDLLGGTAEVYGLVLGAFGIGAVLGAMVLGRIRARFTTEGAVSLSALILGLCIIAISFSRSVPLTMALLVMAGGLWTQSITLFNIIIQLSAPRWVAGRTLAAYQAAVAGGIALGSWLWGMVAAQQTVALALLLSGLAIGATPLLRLFLRLPEGMPDTAQVKQGEVDVALKLTGRSGPIVVEVEYLVDPDVARDFYSVMLELEGVRHRNGAFGWSLARDIADPRLWTERFNCPTWHDYLRLRDRNTRDEMEIIERARAFNLREGGVIVHRSLERPFGSVRWQADTRDEGLHDVLPLTVGPN
jgi:MFS family permease